MYFYYQFDTPVGALGLLADETNLQHLYFPHEVKLDQERTATPLLLEAERQILAYFGGDLREFSLPYDLMEICRRRGNTTQNHRVLSAIANIPYGKVETYGELALNKSFKYPARFVGQVCSKNTLPIIIPCHRVCGKDGTLKGYAGGLALKKYLLDLENPLHGYTEN